MKRSRRLGIICACLTFVSMNVFAVDKFWICGDGSWDDGSCWNPIAQPLDFDDAYLSQNDGLNRTIQYSNPNALTTDLKVVNSLNVDATGGGSVELVINQDILSTSYINVGLNGNGTITQTGGINKYTPGGEPNTTVNLGVSSTGHGTYNLYNGEYGAYQLKIGEYGTGTFNMTGGSAHNEYLSIGNNGTFNLSGGSLTISEMGIGNNGVFNQTGGDASFTGSVSTMINGTYNLIGGNRVDFNTYLGGTFNHYGGSHTTIVGLILSKGGTYNLSGTGSLTGGTGGYGDVIGFDGIGTFNQSGGTNTTSSLSLGGGVRFSGMSNGNGDGTYNLSNGNLSAGSEVIGYDGIGTFNQTGGTNYSSSLSVAENAGSNGTYYLSSGIVDTFVTYIGANGAGTFDQSGGSHSAESGISLGTGVTGNGTYNLTGGVLFTNNISEIGGLGIGTFNQSAGTTHTIDTALIINNKGTYNLNGGTLDRKNSETYVSGTFNQRGGNNIGFNWSIGLIINDGGAYNLSGGTVEYGNITVRSGGSFNQTDGVSSIYRNPVGPVFDSRLAIDGTYNLSGGSLDAESIEVNNNGILVVDNGALNSTNYTNNGEILLTNPIARLKGGNLDNDGLVRGEGRLETMLTNLAGGEIRAQAGNRLLFTGAGNTNMGDINLLGGTAEFTQDLANASGGVIAGRGTLIANSGLTNQGNIGLSSGTTDIFGDVNNATGGTIIVTGNGTATFYDDLVHNGTEIRVSDGSNAVFFGAVSGAGSYTGTGSLFFEGDLNPGNSPGLVSVEGDMGLGLSSHTIMEIAGLGRGTEYDAFDIGADLWLGGKLEVSLYDPGTGLFEPQLGDSFDLFLADTISGDFDLLTLSALGGGLDWQLEVLADAIGLTDVVRLSVVTSAVPVPPSVWLFTSGLLGIIAVARRRQRH